MGAYLSEPVTDKISNDEESERVRYGASSMQGWRVSQEDAHNCIINFDKNTSLFAVYDGHGGHEVSVYCSQKLPDFIKQTKEYQDGDYANALITAFLEFDKTLTTKEIIATLKEIAGTLDSVTSKNKDNSESEDEENVAHLYEEARMPVEQVVEKYYQAALINLNVKKLQTDKIPASPMLKARQNNENTPSSSSSGASSSKSDDIVTKSDEESSSSKVDIVDTKNVDVNDDNTVSSSNDNEESVSSANGESKTDEVKTEEVTKTEISAEKEAATAEKEAAIADKEESEVTTNGETTELQEKEAEQPQTNGEVVESTPKGKGKSPMKKSPKPKVAKKNLRARNPNQHYSQLLMEMEDESESEDDETFEGVNTCSSSESSGHDESSNEEKIANEDDDDQWEDEEEEDEDDFTRNMRDEPGSNSGCTAVVALLRNNELFVANAGDSRCIVCKNGKAVDMSLDHKPEDEQEMDRVIKAGGKVTIDGRVNGGLNLSRAIGDHAYKQNTDLPDKEQMITALPDIRHITINPGEDEFMVLACDGIWNFMSSQEVVDFVRTRLNEDTGPEKLSQICEEMFDHCLAPHTMGDGTGCDNMTAIIVQFKNGILKRAASPESSSDAPELQTEVKRAKTEDC